MGKTNKGQRTKGNTRPSSSGHSAELLSSSGKSLSGFIGFESLSKDIPSYVPTTGQISLEDTDKLVDATFRMIMRRMLKRDPTTRLKAIQEFGEQCIEADKEVVVNVLRFWPRLFNKLALDTDRRIREATHESHGKLLSKVKRDIAPYLKSIMGVWLLGQCDLYTPSAAVAQSTFTDTFPLPRQSEALMFCRVEIFSYFKDNLFEQTAKSMSEPNVTTEEEVENKYNLVISATLYSIKLLVSTVTAEDKSEMTEELVPLLAENRFWKFSKNKSSQIRGAWFSLLGALCRDVPNVFENLGKKVSTSVFSCLSDADPLVAPSVWEAALHVVVNLKDCWVDVDINKLVLPQLWTLLKEGGQGNAPVLYPCLLPLLCKLPEQVTQKESFLQQFLSTLRESLYHDRIKISSVDTDAIIMAYTECLEFLAFHRVNYNSNGSEVLEKLMTDEVLLLIESSFLDSHLSSSKLFPSLGVFIQKMEEKHFGENKEIAEACDKSLTLLLNHISKTCSCLFAEDSEKKKTLEIITYFFHSMYAPSHFLLKKAQNKGRCEDSDEEQHLNSTSPKIRKILLRADSQVMKFTIGFCQSLCNDIEKSYGSEPCFLKLLSEIVTVAKCSALFEGLVKDSKNFKGNESSPPVAFFKLVLLCWMKNESNDASSFCHLIDILFAVCACVENREALNALNSCCEVKNAVLMNELLKKGISSYPDRDVLCEWMKGTKLGKSVVHTIEDATAIFQSAEASVDFDASAHHGTLQNYFLGCASTESKNSGCLSKIIYALKTATTKFCEENAVSKPNLINFVCDSTITILKHCKECWNNGTLEDVLVLLYRHCLKSQPNASDESHKKNVLTWQTAVEVSIENNCKISSGFIGKAANEIHNVIVSSKSTEEFSTILDQAFAFLSKIEDADSKKKPPGYQFLLSPLMEKILPSHQDWVRLKGMLRLNFLPPFFERKVFYPFPAENVNPTSSGKIPQYVMVAEVVSDILIRELGHATEGKDQKIIEEFVLRNLPHLVWSFSYCEGNGYLNRQGTPEYTRTEKLQKNCFRMLVFLTNEKLQSLVKRLFHQSLSEGLEWALPFTTIIEIIKSIHPEYVDHISDLLEQAKKSESQNKYVIAQVLIHHIPTEKKIFILKSHAQDFVQNQICWTESKSRYLGTLGEICSCVQDSDLLQPAEIQICLNGLIIQIITPAESYLLHCKDDQILALQVMAILSAAAKYCPGMLTETLWNLIFEMLIGSLEKCRMAIIGLKSSDFLLLHQTSSLAYVVALLLADDTDQNASLDSPRAVWKDKTFKNVFQDYVFIFNFLGGACKNLKSLPKAVESLLGTVSELTEFIPGELILESFVTHVKLTNMLIRKTSPEDQQASSAEIADEVLKMLTPFLTVGFHSIQFAAHSQIMKVLPLLQDLLKEEPKLENIDDDDDRIPIRLYSLIEQLRQNNEIVESMLLDVKIGDCCCVVPYTDSYTYSMAYLLVWIEIFEFLSSSPTEFHTGYAAYLEESKYLSSLFSNVFRLMPENPAQLSKSGDGTESPKKEGCRAIFINPPLLSSLDHPCSKKLQSVACYVYGTALRKVPSSIRTWWSNLDKRSSEIVDRFTSKYVSGILISDEIQSVCDSEVQFNNMTVRARQFSREVVATYTVDDNAIELFVQLPRNYPLGPVTAEKRGKIEIAQQEWRHWLMQLTTVLTIQNRSLLNGLTIWAKNLDKKFEGVEECTICYYILHAKSHKLPKLLCRTCGKKFHAACLYKWFHTSNNSTCPLCRNEF